MSVKTQHKQYSAMLDKWKRCRDAASGQDAIHDGTTIYLPRLSDQTDGEYAAYIKRTPFYNATWRTVSGLQGMIFRKPAVTSFPPVMKAMADDISLSGEPLQLFTLEVVEELLIVGRIGVFVDYPIVNTAAVTAADAAALQLRPSLKRYIAESIINWRTSIVQNAKVLSRVVLCETMEIVKSEFESDLKTVYRVLDLVTMPQESIWPGKLVYRVRVFEIVENEDVQIGQDVFPILKGQPLNYIPFYFVGVDGCSEEIDNPPMIDLVNINISHYKTNADYEHGCHFTGLPTPVVSGYIADTAKDEKFCIGSTTAWVFPRPDAKAFFLEFTGTGLKSLENNLARKEAQMAVLGARMLENNMNTGKSGNSTAINLGGEQSTLSSISQSVSLGMERALTTFAQFAGSTEPVAYQLNKEFLPEPMDPLRLTALVASWQNGAISYETLYKNLQKGEVEDVDQTVEQEIAKMPLHKPEIPGGTKVNQSANPVHEVTAPTQRQLQTP